MRILIATGIYPPAIGGPAKYALNIKNELERRNHTVFVATYGLENKMPIFFRHIYYFFRLIPRIIHTDAVLAMDTLSVGFPAVCAAYLFRKKIIIRIGGDFLWESYIERTGEHVPLSRFYVEQKFLTTKEKIIFQLIRFTLRHASLCAFNTDWLMRIMQQPYSLVRDKVAVVENVHEPKYPALPSAGKNFLWAVRPIKLKNGPILELAFKRAQEIIPEISLDTAISSHEKLKERIQKCYAVILPSISEVNPNLILEAVSFGKPFIVTQETGLSDEFKKMGMLVDPLNVDDITDKIVKLSNDKIYKEFLAKVATYTPQRTWQSVVDDYLTFFNKLHQ